MTRSCSSVFCNVVRYVNRIKFKLGNFWSGRQVLALHTEFKIICPLWFFLLPYQAADKVGSVAVGYTCIPYSIAPYWIMSHWPVSRTKRNTVLWVLPSYFFSFPYLFHVNWGQRPLLLRMCCGIFTYAIYYSLMFQFPVTVFKVTNVVLSVIYMK